MWYVLDNKQFFETVVLSQSLTAHVLKLAYDDLDYYGPTRT